MHGEISAWQFSLGAFGGGFSILPPSFYLCDRIDHSGQGSVEQMGQLSRLSQLSRQSAEAFLPRIAAHLLRKPAKRWHFSYLTAQCRYRPLQGQRWYIKKMETTTYDDRMHGMVQMEARLVFSALSGTLITCRYFFLWWNWVRHSLSLRAPLLVVIGFGGALS